ncbi:hypothetical protein [Gloeothece verrucosa]|uniref:Uncharacterized protein n=1 Tax=Gloeothece verrucosa (strain PCC 7822) TaxID=497965 RepID=E0UNJ9_GLOV7|nr:hypothetical protein [Gloeothece verrucosa]ADN18529.1 hypothetical protein Cyan7822_6884 [Gloeothece verrucosa PCC 7822]
MSVKVTLIEEIKVNRQWFCYGVPTLKRYPLLFKLLGVRDNLTPFKTEKGIPSDLSEVGKLLLKFHQDQEVGYSYNWLNFDEIKELYQLLQQELLKNRHDLMLPQSEEDLGFDYLFGNGMDFLPTEILPEVEDVRFVYWFSK